MQRNTAMRERMASFQKQIRESTTAAPQPDQKIGEILTAAAGVVGIGAAAAMVASDNHAFWKGVKPSDLIPALRTEFSSDKTQLKVDGSPDALAATVMLGGSVPMLTVYLSAANDGTEVKMSDLTAQGAIATIKEGGQRLLDMAGNAMHVLNHARNGGASADELLSNANQALSKGAGLAETAGNLKLKERAWKVIKQSAETIEASYLSEAEKARQARFTLEKAWENYNTCPTCGVAFGAEDNECRVCGAARMAKPAGVGSSE
jgi:hypothetical protein